MIIKPHFSFPPALSAKLHADNIFKIKGKDGTTIYCIRYEIPDSLKPDAIAFLTTFDKGGAFQFYDPTSNGTVKGRGYAKGNLVPRPDGSNMYEFEIVFLVRERINIFIWIFGVASAIFVGNFPAWADLIFHSPNLFWTWILFAGLNAIALFLIIIDTGILIGQKIIAGLKNMWRTKAVQNIRTRAKKYKSMDTKN